MRNATVPLRGDTVTNLGKSTEIALARTFAAPPCFVVPQRRSVTGPAYSLATKSALSTYLSGAAPT